MICSLRDTGVKARICLPVVTAVVLVVLSCTSEAERKQARIRAKTNAVQEIMARAYQGVASVQTVERRVVVRLEELIPDFAICIPLPPEVNGQKIVEIGYRPKPGEIIERQGQKYIIYYDPPADNFGAYAWTTKIQTVAKTPVEPQESLLISFADLPADTLDSYRGSSGIFDLNSNEVALAADEAVGTDTLLLRQVRRIFEYVEKTVLVKRSKELASASNVLKRGYGSAEEKTIALSALLRQKGFPTRLVATRKERLVQLCLPPYGWLTIDPVDGSLFVGGSVILQCQADFQNFLYRGWDKGISIRRNGSWMRPNDMPKIRVNEKIGMTK